jgi:hypothetical protein
MQRNALMFGLMLHWGCWWSDPYSIQQVHLFKKLHRNCRMVEPNRFIHCRLSILRTCRAVTRQKTRNNLIAMTDFES